MKLRFVSHWEHSPNQLDHVVRENNARSFWGSEKHIYSLCGQHNIYKILEKMVYILTIRLYKADSVTIGVLSGDGNVSTASRRGTVERAYWQISSFVFFKTTEVEFITKKAASELNIDVEQLPFLLRVLYTAGWVCSQQTRYSGHIVRKRILRKHEPKLQWNYFSVYSSELRSWFSTTFIATVTIIQFYLRNTDK